MLKSKMLCPKAFDIPNESVPNGENEIQNQKVKKITEGAPNLELKSYRNAKTWKKSLTNFFRNQPRSTKSNEGDRPSESKDRFNDNDLSPDQKWQSLGKIFRRQSFEYWNKTPKAGEPSQNKRLGVTKVLSSYFGKSQKAALETKD